MFRTGVIGRRGCTGRDLNGKNGWEQKTDVSSPVKKPVTYDSDVSEGVQVTVLF